MKELNIELSILMNKQNISLYIEI